MAFKRCLLRCVLLMCALQGLFRLVAATRSKPVTIAIKSKWTSTSILGEISEYLSDEEDQLFWEFVEGTKDFHWMYSTEQSAYDGAMKVAQRYLPSFTFNLLKPTLALRELSARVEMHQQIALERLPLHQRNCATFVELAQSLICSLPELESALASSSPSQRQPMLYTFDHIYPSQHAAASGPDPPVVILYGRLGSGEIQEFHHALKVLAGDGKITYAFRHYSHNATVTPRLSGYGVRLDIKSTEYKAMDDSKVSSGDLLALVNQAAALHKQHSREVDSEQEIDGFRFGKLKELYPDLAEKLDEYRAHLSESNKELAALKQWQLQDLGYQAAQRVMSSANESRLHALKDLAQNLPLLARSLAKTPVGQELREEIKRNQKFLQGYGLSAGDSYLLIDGIIIRSNELNAFRVLDILKKESKALEQLSDLKLKSNDIQKLLLVPVQIGQSKYLIDMRHPDVVFLNNLEADIAYRRWPKSVSEVLRPTFPGMLRQIAKNLFTFVVCVDPMDPAARPILNFLQLFVQHSVPVRFGVMLVEDGYGDRNMTLQINRAFYYASKQVHGMEAFDWLMELLEQENISESTIRGTLDDAGIDVADDIIEEGTPQDEVMKGVEEFFKSKGLGKSPQLVLNGELLDPQEDLEQSLLHALHAQMSQIQQDVFRGHLTDTVDCYDYFMSKPNVLKRFNSHVIAKDSLQVDLSPKSDQIVQTTPWSSARELTSRELVSKMADLMLYINDEGDSPLPLSLWLITDLSNPEGVDFLKAGIQFLKNNTSSRIAVVHNPTSESAHLLHTEVQMALQQRKPHEVVMSVLEGTKLDIKEVSKVETARSIVEAHKLFCRNTLKLKPGQSGILSNGRLIGPFEDGEEFSEDDFYTLELFELSSHGKALLDLVGSVEIANLEADYDTASFRSDVQMKVASLLRSLPAQQRIVIPSVEDQHSVVHLGPSSAGEEGDTTTGIAVHAFVNPLSTEAQKMVPILQVFTEVLPLEVKIVLNPQDRLSEMPVSSFYRYVLEPKLQFTAVGGLSPGPQAVFATLPEQPLYTANLDIPHAWLVESVWALHDLDNIRLAELDHGVHGDYELEHVLVEGHCSDSQTSSPTPGLQFVLGTEEDPERFDTIVMANLGYFQFKANPGVWQMQLRGGRSADIYHIVSHDAVVDPDSEDKVHVAVDGLGGKFVVLYVGKKEGKEKEKLLADDRDTDKEEEEEEGGLWSSLFGKEAKPELPYKMAPNERIHVFSLASGHLYERFLRIMILSVVKNTQSKVKFWFLKNFLSPSFKEMMPHYAEQYEFEYEYVQYKWPSWLHHQTEKQRIIWGYKILFLDVLFPLNVKKIIFVDADQIVRADLKELVELPLGGAPYGYTPFCDSRTEMDGFRFWKQGYWKTHLGHRKYHISALYVIDLMRFRQLAAGDRLRGQYQALSQDPNSLSNLDQDLPNNMIHQVPIKSLPQEWLWCETWCSDESKAQAKTIDLCNNPLTKEPKLASAVRIVAEWADYDNEIRQFQESIADKLPLPLPSYSGTTPPIPTGSPTDGHEQAHKEL